jgi:hypothetical protein
LDSIVESIKLSIKYFLLRQLIIDLTKEEIAIAKDRKNRRVLNRKIINGRKIRIRNYTIRQGLGSSNRE